MADGSNTPSTGHLWSEMTCLHCGAISSDEERTPQQNNRGDVRTVSVMLDRVRAGEPLDEVMADYGYSCTDAVHYCHLGICSALRSRPADGTGGCVCMNGEKIAAERDSLRAENEALKRAASPAAWDRECVECAYKWVEKKEGVDCPACSGRKAERDSIRAALAKAEEAYERSRAARVQAERQRDEAEARLAKAREALEKIAEEPERPFNCYTCEIIGNDDAHEYDCPTGIAQAAIGAIRDMGSKRCGCTCARDGRERACTCDCHDANEVSL